ncbi:MAG: peptidylprolyl isomerase [Blastocatellia bacterium]|nr:peptidylprolyl isomerase [Blastocatellia bacterium]
MSINALMRIHPEAAIEPIAQQLLSSDAEIKFTATNALARILTSNPGKAPKTVITTASSLLKDSNPHTRAAAAKLLGAAKSRDSITDLTAVLADSDVQVQVSVIRALGAIGDKQAVSALIAYGQKLLDQYRKSVAENSKDKTIKQPTLSSELNQLLVLSSSFGLLKEPTSLGLLKQIRTIPTGRIGANQETEVAIAKFGEEAFFDYDKSVEIKSGDWQSISNFAVGLGELATEKGIKAIDEILFQDKFGKLDPRAIPTITQSAAKAKHPNLHKILLDELKADDVIVRATAAEMLGDSRKDEDFEALTSAFMKASADTMNDAKLAIVAAVAKFPKPETAEFLKGILKDPDYLVRRQASELLRFVTSGNQDNAVARVKTGHDSKFYAEVWALTERTKPVYAQLITSKGSLKIEMFTRDSPVTVYNFMQLAKKGFFNGISFHRVVPNFVVQAGDPRGDGNGGPGFQQRCEMNLKPYLRGTVGMALSGKDTGGSQFFICHSPQPHLDGTYTSFGQVVEGMDVVDKIVRGDTIERVVITE